MSRVPDKDVEQAEPAPTAEAAATAEPAGRVEVDSRGHNVWRWARDVIENTSVLLKRLENKDLALEPTQKVPIMRGRDPAPKASGSDAKTAAAKPTVGKGAFKPPATKIAAKPVASKTTPLQQDRGSDGAGFDPYNSR
jgi:hypothetical protein